MAERPKSTSKEQTNPCENDGQGRVRETFTPIVLTDERGRFALPELLVGQEYSISAPAGRSSWYTLAWVKPREAGQLELGTLRDGEVGQSFFRAGKPAVGDLAPEFEAKTLDGQPLTLGDFRGKYVLLSFWAPSSSRGADGDGIPRLREIHEAFGREERLVILSLSLDEAIDAPRQFQEKRKLPWMQGFLGEGIQGAIPDRYGVREMPAIVLIGPDGKIVAKGMRGKEIKEQVARALKGP